jgi:ECM component-binding autotransporter adhesin
VSYYAPGTDERDLKKIVMSLQQAHSNTATNTTNIATNTANIATNTANIATNTANIATNTAAIAALPAAGTSVQTVYAELTTHTTGTTSMAGGADTVPQNTDGTQLVTVSITPKATANKLNIFVSAPATNSGVVNMWCGVFQDSTASALFATPIGIPVAEVIVPIAFNYQMTAGTTSSTTFKVRIGNIAGASTWAVNGLTTARRLGGSARVTITVIETKT